MGIFDFVKEAGKKLGIGEEEEEQRAPTQTTAQDRGQANRNAAHAIYQNIQKNNIDIENLEVKYESGVVTLSGESANQSEREKAVLLAGNTSGVARVNDQLEVDKEEPVARFYTVKKGDTLSKIAQEFYGNANKYMIIFEANRPMLSDPDKIYPDQVLRIPATETTRAGN